MQPRDPRHLYTGADEPAPRLLDYQRAYARIGVVTALSFEAGLVLILLVLERGTAMLGLIDGLDEVFGCLALVVAPVLGFLGYAIGSAVGGMVYAAALNRWRREQNGMP